MFLLVSVDRGASGEVVEVPAPVLMAEIPTRLIVLDEGIAIDENVISLEYLVCSQVKEEYEQGLVS